MTETLQDKIDAIRINWLNNDLWIYTDVEKAVNKAIQELREEIQRKYLQVEVIHTIPLAQAVYARAMLDVLGLIGEKK